ncbi:MAG: beta-N-acetylhexosaminidase [Gammaproteobacteria bacterium TMED78]|nr:MAG: beta-N-acetylhexosaminidase [Gammaproteobacteria bacterium TMED78]|tara:strand:- start:78194 stop:79219 length:1026 start_codon:yes stop_codon:yes gene_type:complete
MPTGPLMIDIVGTSLSSEEIKILQSPSIGGVILFSRNYQSFSQIVELVKEIKAIKSPSLIVATDHEGGRVQRFKDPFTLIPSMNILGKIYQNDRKKSIKIARKIGWLIAAEIRSIGIDLAFSPVVDLDLGLSTIIGDRSIHSNHKVVSEIATELVSGMKSAGMSSTAKHFPTHAGAKNDSHKETAIDERSFHELANDIYPYSFLINSGIESIMVGHVIFPKIDNVPASLSYKWIKKLRNELKFKGAIITDDLSMAGARLNRDNPSSLVQKAIDVGCDMVIFCNAKNKINKIIEDLSGYVSFDSQPRLDKIRGKKDFIFKKLKESRIYKNNKREVLNLDSSY